MRAAGMPPIVGRLAIGMPLLFGVSVVAADAVPAAPTEARVAPSSHGAIGAWLVLGPLRSATSSEKKKPAGAEALEKAPPGFDELDLSSPRLGSVPPSLAQADAGPKGKEPPGWTLVSSGEGPIDLKAALKPAENDVIAYAAGTLHVPSAGRYLVLVGADDGVRLHVDGKVVLTREESRPYREDDDLVALDLAAGDHPVLLKLHQRDGAWMFRFRIVDRLLAPPAGAWLSLPGTSRSDAETLATKMSWVSLDRGLAADGYRPRLTVRYPEGTPLGASLRVKARAGKPPLFDVDAGEVPADTGELVVTLPVLAGTDLPSIEGRVVPWTVEVAGRSLSPAFYPRTQVRDAVARADRWLARSRAEGSPPLFEDSAETIEHLRDRLVSFQARGDPDVDAQLAEAAELDAALGLAEKGADPFARRTGVLRLAYRSPVDGRLAEYGLYVPPAYRPGAARRFPLVVVLHGLNGRPLATIRYFFGGDDPNKENEWEDRHAADFLKEKSLELDAFVVAPDGHGNTMYRDLGEDDVLRVVERVARRWPVDRDRVTITGPSMGGIGAAAVALHQPDTFAAAMPLCGYHSYFVRRDFLGHPIRPWERALAEERSNVFWAENGSRLPLFVVHGTRDLPVENSQVLIDRYLALRYTVEHEHPDLGHNVWQPTYQDLKGAKWLLKHRRDPHPAHVRFKTMSLHHSDAAWVHLTEMDDLHAWAGVDARAGKKSIVCTTTNVAEIRFDRDARLVDLTTPTEIAIDGQTLVASVVEKTDTLAGARVDEIVLHREAGSWRLGPATHAAPWKKGAATGPLRDAFRAPLIFVWGADDPEQARANEEVARAWAIVRWGVHVKYPIVSDAEFFARGEALANERALFLVGSARTNRVVRALEPDLPIRIDGDAVVIAGQRITGKQLGAAFVRPNPRRPDRYLVVVEGLDALGTWRSLSLPDLLPDFIVWDADVAPARGQMLLGAGAARAAGFFANDWSLPARWDDPLASTPRPPAASERDATPYLP